MGSLSGLEVEMGEVEVARSGCASAAQLPPRLLLDATAASEMSGIVGDQLDCAIGAHTLGALPSGLLPDAVALAPEMSKIKFAQLDCAIGEENLSQLPPKLLLDDMVLPLEMCEMRMDQLDCAVGDKNLAQLSRELLDAPTVLASKKGGGLRKWRRVQRQVRNSALDLNVDVLVLPTRSSLGTGSKKHKDFNRKRIRAKKSSMKGLGQWAYRRAVGNKGDTSSVDSDLIRSSAGHVFCKKKHTGMSMSYDREQSEDLQSEEEQSVYKKDNASDEDFAGGYLDVDRAEEHAEEREGIWVPRDDDPLVGSIASLQTTQEVLESEVQKLSELGKESEIEDSSVDNKEKDVIDLPHVDVNVFELNDKLKHLQQKLKETSATIREKDLRLTELQGVINNQDFPKLQMEGADNDPFESELECLLREKMEAEIQCLVMEKASQSWQFQAEDQIAFLEEHESLAGDNVRMMLKLRDTENKVHLLKQQVENLEIREKVLFGMAEILRMEIRTCKISFFGLIQLIVLCVSLWMFLMQLLPPSGEVVPT